MPDSSSVTKNRVEKELTIWKYNIRVYKPELKQEEGKINNLKGFATITFDEAFCVKSLAIKESSKGNQYLDMPRYRDYETGEYVPFFCFTD